MNIETYKVHVPFTGNVHLLLAAVSDGIRLCDWSNSPKLPSHIMALDHIEDDNPPLLHTLITNLDLYFHGQIQYFDLPLAPIGTEFQKRVWAALSTIPYGATMTYSQLSKHMGFPNSTRAVASAVAANPLSVVIPCHRVIAQSPRAGRYAGGVEMKNYLLELETCGYNAGN